MHRYTPGPWVIEDHDIVGARYICTLTDWHIVRGGPYDEGNAALQTEHEANASLIAAAPEMYEALRRILTKPADATYVLKQAAAAIIKAEGS